jgi:hypothetical protein
MLRFSIVFVPILMAACAATPGTEEFQFYGEAHALVIDGGVHGPGAEVRLKRVPMDPSEDVDGGCDGFVVEPQDAGADR